MLRLGTTVLNVADVRRAAAFWCDALGYRPRDAIEDDWATLVPDDGDGPFLSLQQSDRPAPDVPHAHLDLYADDAEDQRAQIDRVVALGARVVDWPLYPKGGRDFEVLADPDGNRFCIIDTSWTG